MKHRSSTICLAVVLMAFGPSIRGMYMFPETEQVPIARLFTNLQSRLKLETNNFELTYQLARVHSMAYATNLQEANVVKESGYVYWRETRFSGLPESVQVFKSPYAKEIGLKHLTNAVALFDRTLVLMKTATNAGSFDIVQTELGRAWCLDQMGLTNQALAGYRHALKVAWRMEVTGDFSFKEWVSDVWSDVKAMRNPIHSQHHGFIMAGQCYCEEIISYQLKLLDPKKDAQEIADLNEKKKILGSQGRAITPILVPLKNDISFDQLVDPQAGVCFDLDGSGEQRKWGWITPKAAWLVYDSDGSGRITSALQMFGSVTFWIFWKDGYAALAALDDDFDGMLRGEELNHLALWHDANSNGISDPGEVTPVGGFGITSISCWGESHPLAARWNAAGIVLKDGTTRATYDWISRSDQIQLFGQRD